MGSGFRYVTVQHLYDGTSINPANLPRTELSESEIEKYRLNAGDIVICKSSVKKEGIGYASKFLGSSEPVAYSGFTARIRAQREIAFPDYLFHVLRWRQTRQWLVRHSQQSAITNLNQSIMDAIPIPLIPLPEQRKIATILSSVDDAIEKTQAVIDQVQIVKRCLMQTLLTRGLPARDRRFKPTEIGEIPEEWDLLPLAVLAQAERGLQTGPFGSQLHAADYVEEGVPVLMPKDMINGYGSDENSARISDERAEELGRHRVQEGDILFARRGELGRVGLITKHQEGWVCGTGCLRFRPKDRGISPYLRQWVSWPTSVQWLNENAVGQTMLNLNTSILGRLPVALPSDTERLAIVEVLETLEQQLRALEQKVRGLGEVKRSLTSVLLTGELRATPETESA